MLLKMNNEMRFANTIRFDSIQFEPKHTKPNQTNPIIIHFIEMIPSGLVFDGI